MIGLIAWTRSFTYDSDGNIIYGANGPVFASHPQPNLYVLLSQSAKALAPFFDAIQLPPITNGSGEGYSPFCLRDFNSNWGTKEQLQQAIASLHKEGVFVSADLAYRQQNGANGGPGVFKYPDGIGDTTPGWFQSFDPVTQPIPPWRPQDSVPDPSGNYAFGLVRANENSDPPGVVEADTKSALALLMELFK
jgi:hypothetical protein